jgi:glutamine synthetase
MAKHQDCDMFRELNDPLRKERVARVSEKIKALGIEYIYYQYISITGRVLGKAVPARHWDYNARKGVQTWMGGVTNVSTDMNGTLFGFSAMMARRCAARPETFCQLPWDKRCPGLLHAVLRPRGCENPGGYFECDTRGNLKRFDWNSARSTTASARRHGAECCGEEDPTFGRLIRDHRTYAYHIGQLKAPVTSGFGSMNIPTPWVST